MCFSTLSLKANHLTTHNWSTLLLILLSKPYFSTCLPKYLIDIVIVADWKSLSDHLSWYIISWLIYVPLKLGDIFLTHHMLKNFETEWRVHGGSSYYYSLNLYTYLTFFIIKDIFVYSKSSMKFIFSARHYWWIYFR